MKPVFAPVHEEVDASIAICAEPCPNGIACVRSQKSKTQLFVSQALLSGEATMVCGLSGASSTTLSQAKTDGLHGHSGGNELVRNGVRGCGWYADRTTRKIEPCRNYQKAGSSRRE